MATSSLSRDFVINDPKAVDKLIKAMENPVKIHLKKRDPEEEQKNKEKVLCKVLARIDSLK